MQNLLCFWIYLWKYRFKYETSVGTNSKSPNFEHPNFGISELRTWRTYAQKSVPNSNFESRTSNFRRILKRPISGVFAYACRFSFWNAHKVSPVFPKKLHFFLYSSPLCITIIRFQKFLVSKRYFWPKKSLKRAQKGSKSSPNFNIELRTSRTLLSSPRLELNELEHPKKVELRTRTQVRSTTRQN